MNCVLLWRWRWLCCFCLYSLFFFQFSSPFSFFFAYALRCSCFWRRHRRRSRRRNLTARICRVLALGEADTNVRVGHAHVVQVHECVDGLGDAAHLHERHALVLFVWADGDDGTELREKEQEKRKGIKQ